MYILHCTHARWLHALAGDVDGDPAAVDSGYDEDAESLDREAPELLEPPERRRGPLC